jgi:hypothetical protein
MIANVALMDILKSLVELAGAVAVVCENPLRKNTKLMSAKIAYFIWLFIFIFLKR